MFKLQFETEKAGPESSETVKYALALMAAQTLREIITRIGEGQTFGPIIMPGPIFKQVGSKEIGTWALDV